MSDKATSATSRKRNRRSILIVTIATLALSVLGVGVGFAAERGSKGTLLTDLETWAPNVRPHVLEITRRFPVESATRPDHQPDEQHAADFMTYRDVNTQNALADFARANSERLEVQYIISRQRIWNIDRGAEGWRFMADRGSPSDNHMDHVHIAFKRGVAKPAGARTADAPATEYGDKRGAAEQGGDTSARSSASASRGPSARATSSASPSASAEAASSAGTGASTNRAATTAPTASPSATRTRTAAPESPGTTLVSGVEGTAGQSSTNGAQSNAGATLPVTGADPTTAGSLGLGLLLGGATLIATVGRRRRPAPRVARHRG